MSCSYVHRPETPSDWDDRALNEVIDGRMAWACPREVADGSDRCVFHRPLEATDPGAAREAFAAAIERARGEDGTVERERLAFIGATLPALDLRGESVGAGVDCPLDLRAAEIHGDLRLDEARVGTELRLDGVEVGGRTTLDEATFERALRARSATFHGQVSARGTAFEGAVELSDASFGADAVFVRADVHGAGIFRSTSFGRANFRHATFEDRVTFGGATFRTPPSFRSTAFRGDAVFLTADLSGADLVDAGLAGANLRRANLTDADLTRARLNGAEMEHARLNRATLAGADLRGAGLFGCLLGDAGIDDRTRFGRRCVYDPRYDGEYDPVLFEDDDSDGPPATPAGFARKAEATYRLLERLYGANAFPRRARAAYRARRTVRRYRLFADRSVGRWAVSKLLDLTTGYGERPGRVVGLSAVVIVLFAGAYSMLGGVTADGAGGSPVYALAPDALASVPLPDAGVVLLTNLYFSAVVFASLGYGGFTPGTAAVRGAAATEALVGTLLAAVLVVVLARRTMR